MAAKKKPKDDEGLSILPHPAVSENEPAAPAPSPDPLLADAPSLQADARDDSNFDIAADPPSAPVAPAVITVTDPALEERIRHLEALLAQVQNINQLEQRVAERVATQIQRQQPAPSSGPTVFGQARSLLDVGRHLLPGASAPNTTQPGSQQARRSNTWLLWELIAEFRAIFCMYLDPRYRVPWYGYVVPPALLFAFIFSKYWVPFALVLGEMRLSWMLTIPVDLVVLYAMFKVLGHEARRYRETAPDLPPSLRL